ncbi:hypothetical protein DUI87_02305 [Hirundo rustica rustica]|uniref:Reverse transcriptase thumb domain-containing protein n=1 Tax=Hirundo rustica rustica TaxID=333673 RepID=A0A3M0L7F2_HIRRU|nr:hypothetical protein DUI87_02305 [Hirundo rustica rustica]
MDDILICTETDYYLETVLEKTIQAIEGAEFEIATENIQRTCPWTYLGFRIGEQTIAPQQLIIKDNPRTLRDLQQLCGSINWRQEILSYSISFPSANTWIVPQANQNIWVTLAKTLQQDNLCLSMGNVDNPLSTCLVGVPLAANEYPYTDKKPNPVDTWDEWTRPLPQAPEEPKNWSCSGLLRPITAFKFNINFPMNS